MAELNDPTMAEVMSLLEAKPSITPAGGAITQPGPDIPALREQLAILVSTGKAKEAVGAELTHEHVRRLSDKDVEKYAKRYETYVGSRTTESLMDSFLMLVTKSVGAFVRLKDADALHNELKNDYIITKELSTLSGGLALRCGRSLAVGNALLIIAKHIDFSSSAEKITAPVVEQSQATAE